MTTSFWYPKLISTRPDDWTQNPFFLPDPHIARFQPVTIQGIDGIDQGVHPFSNAQSACGKEIKPDRVNGGDQDLGMTRCFHLTVSETLVSRIHSNSDGRTRCHGIHTMSSHKKSNLATVSGSLRPIIPLHNRKSGYWGLYHSEHPLLFNQPKMISGS